nr:formin-like protein 2 [Ipomoea trifida]
MVVYSLTTVAGATTHRRILHQPLYPLSTPLTPTPPPDPTPTIASEFYAVVSEPVFPSSSGNSSRPISRKLIAVIVAVSLVFAALLTLLAAFLLHHRDHEKTGRQQRTDSLRLVPPNATPSDADISAAKKKSPPPPPLLPRYQATASSTSSEFLYLGTLVSSREVNEDPSQTAPANAAPENYQRLGSPELRPLPPLPRPHFRRNRRSADADSADVGSTEEDDEEEFFSPKGSTGGRNSPNLTSSNSRRAADAPVQVQSNFPFSNSNSPTASLSASPSIELNLSPRSLRSKSPDSLVNFPAPPRFIPPPPPLHREIRTVSVASPSSGDTHNSPYRPSDFSAQISESPVSQLPDSGRFWEPPVTEDVGPPVLVPPSRPVVSQNVAEVTHSSEAVEKRNEETMKPKLKPLHWDKVRASSDRVMVWDQLKSSSFQLNEEMIETLFMVNSNSDAKDGVKRPLMPLLNQENRVLDPKKSQNIAILLRALNVTVEEVCEALVEGTADSLGTELLESLLKMAPTKEEERQLKEFKDESPFKLCPAEKFLRAVLDIPFAFRRVDAMLYIANFDSEVEYLKRSFETLEAACEELRKSRMFLKLLEAVLKTGNRMNVGTNRGDARAFKLDTLLKLVDVKGTDGKTTLLHFVVQEIIRAEGSRISGFKVKLDGEMIQKPVLQEEVEFRKVGLQVVSGLSGELTNVKKAAGMDSEVLTNEVAKLADGVAKIAEVARLNEEVALKENNRNFSESMNAFLKKAKVEIMSIQSQEDAALSMVKELTEYFHGDLAKEEAHPFRIFLVVRDFLSTLDQVCKDVGKINERTIVSSGRQFPMPVNAALPLVFPGYLEKQHDTSSSDDESSSSTV